jgi:hypothetical protein
MLDPSAAEAEAAKAAEVVVAEAVVEVAEAVVAAAPPHRGPSREAGRMETRAPPCW